jgi:hypothetical protein
MASITGTDNAGNTTSVKCPYAVRALAFSPAPTIDWRLAVHKPPPATQPGKPKQAATKKTAGYDTVERLVVRNVPSSTLVTVSCRGKGCPFRVATCPATRCTRRAGGRIDLTPLFKGRQLLAGAQLTLTVTRANTIGRVWLLTVRESKQPTYRVLCLAPSSRAPGTGC